MWSILENRYEHGSWWTISFSLLCVHIRFASLYLFIYFFIYPRFRRWVFSKVTSPCSLLCWNWYRKQEILLQQSKQGPKPQPWRGQIKIRVQNGYWSEWCHMAQYMLQEWFYEVLPSLNCSNSSYFNLSGEGALKECDLLSDKLFIVELYGIIWPEKSYNLGFKLIQWKNRVFCMKQSALSI